MAELERQRRQRIDRGEDAATVDRETAQVALTAVADFFHAYGIEAKPLVRLLGELAALTAGSARRACCVRRPPVIVGPVRRPSRRSRAGSRPSWNSGRRR